MHRRSTSEGAGDEAHQRARQLTAWINNVTRNLVLQRYPNGFEITSIDGPVPAGGDGPIAAGSQVDEDQENQNQIKLAWIKREGLPRLTQLQQIVITLYYVSGLSDKEITEYLNPQPKLCKLLALGAKPKEANIKKTRHQALNNLKEMARDRLNNLKKGMGGLASEDR